jgi:lipoprotein NlpD
MRLSSLLLAFVLAGCASRAPAPVADSQVPQREAAKAAKPAAAADKFYTVKKGDTLYSIALDHGLEYRELAALNNIENPSRIRVGQQLRVAAAAAEPVAPAGGAEVKPIAGGGPVAVRPLDEKPLQPAPAAVPREPTLPANTATLKRGPKGGKLPYSEENLALLKAQEKGQESVPVAVSAPPVAPAVAPSEKPADKAAEKPAGEIDWAWPAGGKVIGTYTEGGDGALASKGIDIAGKIGEPVQAAAAGKVVYVGSGLRGYGNLVIVRHSPVYLSAYAHNSRILVKEGQAVTRGQKIAELGDSDADQPKLHFEVRQQGKPVDPLKFLPAR